VRRLMWTAVGAAAGIYVYRRLQVAVDDARERGLAGNVAVASSVATTIATQVRALAAGGAPGGQATPAVRPGRAAAEVLRGQTRAAVGGDQGTSGPGR
jgi:hypothetical protein